MSTKEAERGTPVNRAPNQSNRYVMSHRRAGKQDRARRVEARANFHSAFQKAFARSVDVIGDVSLEDEDTRQSVIFRASAEEVAAKSRELSADVLLEPELPRRRALAHPPEVARLLQLTGQLPSPAGSGARLALTLRSDGAPLPFAKVLLFLVAGRIDSNQATTIGAVTDDAGSAVFSFDGSVWSPAMALIEPQGGAWSMVLRRPSDNQVVVVPPLPKDGPTSWWSNLDGISAYELTRGAGIKIGVIDTGAALHPNLQSITRVGACIDGVISLGVDPALDEDGHGTHVAGIIAGAPPLGSGAYAGLAPGAEVFAVRVFPPGGDANQLDIANAIDLLASDKQVDLINLSLGSSQPSAIELDAIIYALELGSLCVCAAGNGNGSPVYYPAAHPQTIAVSALGLPAVAPAGTVAADCSPADPLKFSPYGLYLANFSNVGPEITVCAPGVGIISTIPPNPSAESPYADMSGTSMSCPAVTAALASLLARDPTYKQLARGAARAAHARLVLTSTAVTLGLSLQYQGAGLARGA